MMVFDLDTQRQEKATIAAQDYWMEGNTDAIEGNSPQNKIEPYLDGYFHTLRRLVESSDRHLCPTWQDTPQVVPPFPALEFTCGDCLNFVKQSDSRGYCPCSVHSNEWGEPEVGKAVRASTPACDRWFVDAHF